MNEYKKIIILILFVVCLFIVFLNAGKFLVINEAPQKSDVIIVLSGDRGDRTVKGVELYKKGYAPNIIMSGGQVYHTTTMADLMKAHAVELGVPEKSIITESKADSTYENAAFSLQVMKQYGFKSAIVVSSNYHMRRVKLLFDREFKEAGIKLVYCASPDQYFEPDHWWHSNKSIMTVLNEYIKLVGYFLGKNY